MDGVSLGNPVLYRASLDSALLARLSEYQCVASLTSGPASGAIRVEKLVFEPSELKKIYLTLSANVAPSAGT